MVSNGRANGLAELHTHPSYRWFVLANVMIGTFMAVLDVTIVNVGYLSTNYWVVSV